MAAQQATVGSRAPDFELPCTRTAGADRQRVALGDYQDRWLALIFYPRDFSLVCPTELTALSARIEEFRRRGCDILGVSTDSLATHERWIGTSTFQGGLGSLNFPLASDEDGSVCRAYGVYVPRQHVALRGLFLIDPNGVLQYQVVHNLSVGRRAGEVLRVLDALQTGGLCPSDWDPDSPVLDVSQSLGPGTMLGPYRIESEIGRGSFGAVYRAFDSLLERIVALKVLPSGDANSSEAMLREARAAAALVHANICTIFSVDASEGVPMIVMEYLEGRPLSKLLEEGPLPESQAAAIGRQMAEGMAAAHASGVVHGDLKPANIMITHSGAAKILDFGLARRTARIASTDETGVWEARPEQAGGISGTPIYMSPEQARGDVVTPASDVFSLTLVLYEMLTGRKAITGNNLLELLRNVDTIEADRYAAQFADPFRAIFTRGLVIDPSQRQITMSEISASLA